MKIRLLCPSCDTAGRVASGTTTWTCPACETIVQLHSGTVEGSTITDPNIPITSCAVCGNQEIYRKKDFPHGLGMAILVGAFIASTITYLLYFKILTWVILIGSAAFDGILYLLVGDAIVCYRCHAEHVGWKIDPEKQPPFDLATHERYRQERLRKDQIHSQG